MIQIYLLYLLTQLLYLSWTETLKDHIYKLYYYLQVPLAIHTYCDIWGKIL